MRKVLAILALLLSCANYSAAQEVALYVGQSHDEWAFNITGKGRSVIGDSLIFTRIDHLQITNNPKHEKHKNLDYVSVGYGYRKPDGKWTVEVVGPRHEVGRVLGPGDFMTFNRLDAILSLKDKKAEDYWIVITVGTGQRSKVYAHSREDIFQ